MTITQRGAQQMMPNENHALAIEWIKSKYPEHKLTFLGGLDERITMLKESDYAPSKYVMIATYMQDDLADRDEVDIAVVTINVVNGELVIDEANSAIISHGIASTVARILAIWGYK